MYVGYVTQFFYFFIGVSNLRSSSKTTNTITMMWYPDSYNCGSVLYYNVTIVNSVNSSDMNITESSESTIKFSNLINGTTYNISVAAINRAGTGPTSTISVTTLVVDEVTAVDSNDMKMNTVGDSDTTGMYIHMYKKCDHFYMIFYVRMHTYMCEAIIMIICMYICTYILHTYVLNL